MANDMVTITISRSELEKKIGTRKAQALQQPRRSDQADPREPGDRAEDPRW